MCDYPRPSEKVEPLRQYHQSQGSRVQQTLSPRDAYETELKDANEKVREASCAFTRDGSALMDGSDLVGVHPNCDTLLLAVERMQQLKVRGTTADITTDLEFSPIADLPNSGDPSAGDQVEEEGQPADSTMTLDYILIVSDLQQPTPAVLSTPNIPPVSDRACNPGNYTNENQHLTMGSPRSHTRNLQMTPRPKSSKRKRRAKRPIPSGPLTNRTIEFSEVYQDGHAAKKYVIDKCGDY